MFDNMCSMIGCLVFNDTFRTHVKADDHSMVVSNKTTTSQISNMSFRSRGHNKQWTEHDLQSRLCGDNLLDLLRGHSIQSLGKYWQLNQNHCTKELKKYKIKHTIEVVIVITYKPCSKESENNRKNTSFIFFRPAHCMETPNSALPLYLQKQCTTRRSPLGLPSLPFTKMAPGRIWEESSQENWKPSDASISLKCNINCQLFYHFNVFCCKFHLLRATSSTTLWQHLLQKNNATSVHRHRIIN